MRLFFALEPDSDTALAIGNWRDSRLATDGRPVPPANFHITLAFVGDLTDARTERLASAVDAWQASAAGASGELTLDCPGYWPRARIFWLGSTQWPDSLAAVAGKLRRLASSAGARKDGKPFRPHVTLFRGCEQPPTAPTALPHISWRYSHFSLMESVQGKSGVSYRPLASWDLT